MTAGERREANDYRRRTFGRDPERPVAFICECVDEDCRRAVLLTSAQYDELRETGRAVVVDPTHPAPAG